MDTATAGLALKPKDYKSDIKPVWCPGCGDFAVLNAITKALAYLQLVQKALDEIKTLLQYAFQTKNALTMPVSAPGSAGMETCFVNLVAPGDKVIVCQNGVFGGRMKENVERCGGHPVMVLDPWGSAVDPQKLEDALKTNPDAALVAFVHAETSTGAQSDVKTLVELASAG